MTELNEPLIVDVDLKESDLQRATFWFRLRWSTRILLVFFFVTGLILLTRIDLSTIFQNPPAATALIVLIGFPVSYPMVIWYQTKRGFGNLQGVQTRIEYSFSPDGYTVRDIKSSATSTGTPSCGRRNQNIRFICSFINRFSYHPEALLQTTGRHCSSARSFETFSGHEGNYYLTTCPTNRCTTT